MYTIIHPPRRFGSAIQDLLEKLRIANPMFDGMFVFDSQEVLKLWWACWR